MTRIAFKKASNGSFSIWLIESFFLSIHTATPFLKDYEQVYIVHAGFARWKPTSNHVNSKTTIGFFNLHKGWSLHRGPPVNRSEGRRTYLVPSLQMILRKTCTDTEIFPRLLRGSNPWPLAIKASALATRLPRFLSTFRWNGSIKFQVECNLPTLRYNTVYPNELFRVKKNESVLCTFLSLFSLTTSLFSLTTVHGVCVSSFNYTFV